MNDKIMKTKIKCNQNGIIFNSKYDATKWLIEKSEFNASFNSVYSRLNAHIKNRLHSGKGKNSKRGFVKSIYGYTFKEQND